jgi:putative FmdB family regulatory protein
VPIYEYECERCEERFELMQKFSDKPIKKCHKCGGPVHKMLSAPALVFKGAGWYVNDYANADRKRGQKAESDSKSSSTTTSTPSAETSKPASTSKTD